MSEKVVAITDRKSTAAEWTSSNPVLALGEHGYETDTKKEKIGDGTTAWNSLAYKNTDQIIEGSNNLYFTIARCLSSIFGSGTISPTSLSSTLTLPFDAYHNRHVYYTSSVTTCTISIPSSYTAGIPQYTPIRNTGSSSLVLTISTSSNMVSTDYTVTVATGTAVEISYMAYNYTADNPNWVITVSAAIS